MRGLEPLSEDNLVLTKFQKIEDFDKIPDKSDNNR